MQAGRGWSSAGLEGVAERLSQLLPTRPPKAVLPRPPRIARILLCVDGSDVTAPAEWARVLARLWGASVRVLAVHEPAPRLRGALEKAHRDVAAKASAHHEAATRQAEEVVADLRANLVRADARIRRGFPAFEIEREARTSKADLVVLGAHRPRQATARLGRVAEAVVHGVAANVLVAREAPRPGPVLVPVDGSPESRIAVAFGIAIANAWDRDALILHVFEPPLFTYEGQGAAEFRSIIEKAKVPSRTPHARYLLATGKPSHEVLSLAQKEKTPLIVLGSRGLGGLRRLLMGSVSSRVLREAATNVLVVKRRRA